MTGISGSIGVYYQNARVRFLCPLPLPLASLWCIVLDADSDDSAPLASWALTALSTAWRRTFYLVNSFFTLDPLHRDRLVVFERHSACKVKSMRLCLWERAKVVYQPCHMVRRRLTKVSCENTKRERDEVGIEHALCPCPC